jgi:hypothetical protein
VALILDILQLDNKDKLAVMNSPEAYIDNETLISIRRQLKRLFMSEILSYAI